MLREFNSMQDLGTFTEVLSELPPGVKPTPSKPVFAIKEHPTEPEVLKTRIVVRGDLQADDSFDSTFAPVAADNSLMLLLNVALQLDLELYQLDVKTAFLNSPIVSLTSGLSCLPTFILSCSHSFRLRLEGGTTQLLSKIFCSNWPNDVRRARNSM